MAIQVKHKFVTAKVDTLDSTKVQPSNWNDTHDILLAGGVVVGRAAGGGQAAATEIPMGVTGQALLAAPDQATAQSIIGADDSRTTILASASKTTPVDGDQFGILDSAASNVYKRLSWLNLKATLKTYFDTLYAAVGVYFVSSTTTVGLATTGAGTINLRPNGAASTTGQMSIDSSGNVTVAGNLTANSDVALKENIQRLDTSKAIAAILSIDPVSFTRKATGDNSIGFIAQDVEQYFPELVKTDQETGLKSLAYQNMNAVLWEVVRHLLQKEQEK